jgi:hypothetical protein
MAITCRVTIDAGSGAVALYPELPVEYTTIPIVDDRRMLNGQTRRAYRAAKLRIGLRLSGATEAEFTTWAGVADFSTSLTFVNERGQSFTVNLVDWTYPLSRTVPDVEGGTNTTGAGYYDLAMTLEQV